MKFWTTKSGEKILPKNMKDSHIKNSWEMFAPYNCQERQFLLKEAKRRKLKLPEIKISKNCGRRFEQFHTVLFGNGSILYEWGRPVYVDDGNGQEWSEDDDWGEE